MINTAKNPNPVYILKAWPKGESRRAATILALPEGLTDVCLELKHLTLKISFLDDDMMTIWIKYDNIDSMSFWAFSLRGQLGQLCPQSRSFCSSASRLACWVCVFAQNLKISLAFWIFWMLSLCLLCLFCLHSLALHKLGHRYSNYVFNMTLESGVKASRGSQSRLDQFMDWTVHDRHAILYFDQSMYLRPLWGNAGSFLDALSLKSGPQARASTILCNLKLMSTTRLAVVVSHIRWKLLRSDTQTFSDSQVVE